MEPWLRIATMTIMARTLGIPARYVTGYGLKQADKRPNTVNYIASLDKV